MTSPITDAMVEVALPLVREICSSFIMGECLMERDGLPCDCKDTTRAALEAALPSALAAAEAEPRRIEVDIGRAYEALQTSPELCAEFERLVGGPALVEAKEELERLRKELAAAEAKGFAAAQLFVVHNPK